MKFISFFLTLTLLFTINSLEILENTLPKENLQEISQEKQSTIENKEEKVEIVEEKNLTNENLKEKIITEEGNKIENNTNVINTNDNTEVNKVENLDSKATEINKEEENKSTKVTSNEEIPTESVVVENKIDTPQETKTNESNNSNDLKENITPIVVESNQVEIEPVKLNPIAKLKNIEEIEEDFESDMGIYSFLGMIFSAAVMYIIFLIYNQSKRYDFLNHDLNTECGYELLEDRV